MHPVERKPTGSCDHGFMRPGIMRAALRRDQQLSLRCYFWGDNVLSDDVPLMHVPTMFLGGDKPSVFHQRFSPITLSTPDGIGTVDMNLSHGDRVFVPALQPI